MHVSVHVKIKGSYVYVSVCGHICECVCVCVYANVCGCS